MDKGRERKDLLAAGRKKFNQFRKSGGGDRKGKPSKKAAGKSDTKVVVESDRDLKSSASGGDVAPRTEEDLGVATIGAERERVNSLDSCPESNGGVEKGGEGAPGAGLDIHGKEFSSSSSSEHNVGGDYGEVKGMDGESGDTVPLVDGLVIGVVEGEREDSGAQDVNACLDAVREIEGVDEGLSSSPQHLGTDLKSMGSGHEEGIRTVSPVAELNPDVGVEDGGKGCSNSAGPGVVVAEIGSESGGQIPVINEKTNHNGSGGYEEAAKVDGESKGAVLQLDELVIGVTESVKDDSGPQEVTACLYPVQEINGVGEGFSTLPQHLEADLQSLGSGYVEGGRALSPVAESKPNDGPKGCSTSAGTDAVVAEIGSESEGHNPLMDKKTENIGSGGCGEVTRVDGEYEDAVPQLNESVISVESEMGSGGQELNACLGDVRDIEGAGESFSSSSQHLEADLQNLGSVYEEGGRSLSPVAESKLDFGVEDGSKGCYTSAGTDVVVAEIGSESEGQIPEMVEKTDSVVIHHLRGEKNVEEYLSWKGGPAQELDIVHLSAVPSEEETEVAGKVWDPHLCEKQGIVNQNLFGADTESGNVTSASGRMEGNPREINQFQCQQLDANVITESEEGSEVPYAIAISHLEVAEEPPGDKGSSALNVDQLNMQGTVSLSASISEGAEANFADSVIHTQLEAQAANIPSFQEAFPRLKSSSQTIEKNEHIHEELSYYKSELKTAISRKEEVELLLKSAQGEIEILNARVCSLQSQMEACHQGSSATTSEILALKSKMTAVEKEMSGSCVNLETESAVVSGGMGEAVTSSSGTFEDLQGLSNRCSILAKKLEGFGTETLPADASSSDDIFTDKNQLLEVIDAHISQIEASVDPFLQKYDNATKDISLSKTYLGEMEFLANVSGDITSMPLHILLKETICPKLVELSEIERRYMPSSSTPFEKGDEIQTLNKSVNEMEKALKMKCAEFDSKAAELEQSEHKLSSVREKLSIAVAKGKGLVAQRDHLKQSLVEKTSELEKCSQELRTKEMMLHEAETKLKSYPEVDRVEALESELSYIRNSATAFRDSFLLKDSMIQRIEEVLEDLDLPEHFHSRDTIEKIQLLSRSAANNSFMVTDWDQRGPVGESHLGEGSGAPDASREDEPAAPGSETDELRRRFDELQRKFYGLAEQNDMLEQSLMERHSVVQRWEELLDMIDMPAYLKSMEPVVRLEWLGKALPEVQREHNSLLAKVEDLEESNESLIGNLQDLRRTVSELEAALESTENEKNSLSALVSKLRLEMSELSTKEAQNEELERRISELEVALTSAENESVSLSTQVSKLTHENSELSAKEIQNKELQRKISELETTIVSIENERVIFSAHIDELRLEITNKESQYQLEMLHLQKEASGAREKLAETISHLKDIQTFIDDSTSENESTRSISSDDPIDNIKCSLRRLVDGYKSLIEETKIECSGKLATEENKMAEEQKMKELLDDKEKDLIILKTKLDDVSRSLEVLKKEADAMAEKNQLLLVDMEEIVRQRDTLVADNEVTIKKYGDLKVELLALKAQVDEASHRILLVEEEKNSLSEGKHAVEADLDEMIRERDLLLLERETTLGKCQDLLSDVHLLSKQRDTAVEQLNQEEQRSASVREKLKAQVDEASSRIFLVEEEKNSLSEGKHAVESDLDEMIRERDSLLLEREATLAKCQDLLSNVHLLSNQRDTVVEKLNQEEQRSASVREKLKVQVDEASHRIILVEEENKSLIEGKRAVESNLDEVIRERDSLLLEREETLGKYQDLLSDVGLLSKQRDTLMEQLNQEEQRSASVREKLKVQVDEASHRIILVQEENKSLIEGKRAVESNLDEVIRERDSLLLEREETLGKCQDLLSDVSLLSKQRDTLMEQLNQEEQRSASVREKLNIAVRKGKALVQQRDGLKQAIEEVNLKVDQLQNQLNQTALENSSLRNKLIETESALQDNKEMLNGILAALHAINVAEVPPGNPVQMIEGIKRLLNDRLLSALSKEQEAKKSRHAAELLLAELNEVQERADNLQEELSKAEITLAECCRERDEAKVARVDAISKLEQVKRSQSEERKKEAGEILFLRSRLDEFRNGFLDILNLIYEIFSKDNDLIYNLSTTAESVLRLVNGTTPSDNRSIPSHGLLHLHSSRGAKTEENIHMANLPEHLKGQVAEHLHHASQCLDLCVEELDYLKETANKHYDIVERKAKSVSLVMEATQKEMALLSTSSEPLSIVVNRLEISEKDKENEISMLQRCLILLFEACKSSILEFENRKSGEKGSEFDSELVKMITNLPNCIKKEESQYKSRLPITEEHVKMVAEMLSSVVRDIENMLEESTKDKHKKLKSLISDLQRELQEKDIQKNRICAELVSQIRDAESLAKIHHNDLESAKREMNDLESQLKVMEKEKKILEGRANDLNDLELSSKDLQSRVNSLSESVAARDQEIEGLMQALDAEELKMESLQARNRELEKLLEEKAISFESLESSRAKATMKLSTTVDKFDELRRLSENLLVEVENLQSQLQERDLEVSFLRQEVTRCTKDVLVEQESRKNMSNNIRELQLWIATMFSRFGVQDVNFEDQFGILLDSHRNFLDERLSSIVSELNDLRVNSQNKDALLQTEKSRVHELLQKTEALETSLHDKESQITLYQQTKDSGQLSASEPSEPLEIEAVRSKGGTSSSVFPLIRSGRRIVNDQVVVDVDMEQVDSLDDEDDDKAHGFKSLTMSKVIPKFTRPVAERVDGLWVSIERLLMRQPSLRLLLIIYWITLHAMLVASI